MPGPIALELAVNGKTATFTLRNTGSTPVLVLTRVLAGNVHYDWFTLDLEGPGGTRRLHFTDDRNRSGTEAITLDAGATWSGEADLAAWAARPANGATPLPTGQLTLRATYEVTAQNAAGKAGVWIGKAVAPPVQVTW